MFKFGNPQHFRSGSVVPLEIRDEHNQLLTRLPATVEQANGIEPELAPITEASAEAKPEQNAADVSIRERSFGEVLQALAFLQADKAAKARAVELYSELIEKEAEVTALLAEVGEAQTADLREQHTRIREECRSTIARIRELEGKLPTLEGRLRALQSETSKARATLASWTRSEPNRGFPEYADQDAIEAWKTSTATAQGGLTAAEIAEAAVVGEYNQIVHDIGVEREALNGHRANIAAVNDFDRPGLIEREAQLLAQVEGKPWTDSTTGLKSTPMVLI